jgi:hypothetical protein
MASVAGVATLNDAVQLASALAWQESVGTEIVLATFDQQLWEPAPKAGVKTWPDYWKF